MTFNIYYHPVFHDARKISEEMYVIPESGDGHKNKNNISWRSHSWFKTNNSFKEYLVRSKLQDIDDLGRSKPCRGKKFVCHLCKVMKCTCTFKEEHLDEYIKLTGNITVTQKWMFI